MGTGQLDQGVSADAAATMARQQADIETLQRRLREERFAQDLRDALATASATGTISAPVSYAQLLRTIVATAADMADAKAASLFLIDADQKNLVLEAALGDAAAAAERFCMPLGHGVAGLVAQSGHPMAIADTPEDDLDETDLGYAVGFNPTSLLCVPLSFQDRVIGALQLLEKEGEATFSVDDIESIGLFANLAAIAIEQSRTESRISALVTELVRNVDGLPDFDRHGLTERARAFTAELGQQSGYLDALELARLVQEVVQHGDAATDSCKAILNGFVGYLRSRPTPGDHEGSIPW